MQKIFRVVGAAIAVVGLALGSACDDGGSGGGAPPGLVTPTVRPHTVQLRDPSVPIDPVEHQKMIDYINRTNDPRIVRMTIDDGDGEVVNCVDPIWQHGLDRPPMPDSLRRGPPAYAGPPPPVASPFKYGKVGPMCPIDTAPRLRHELADIERYFTLEDYFNRAAPPSVDDTYDDHYVHTFMDFTGTGFGPSNLFFGGGGEFNTFGHAWNWYVENGDHSVSQMWVRAGENGGACALQSAEVAIDVDPAWHGNSNQYLVIYTTNDNYYGVSGASGCTSPPSGGNSCWNGDCGGADYWYTQAGAPYFPGEQFASTSAYGGSQVDVRFDVERDDYAGWWVFVNGSAIGSWGSGHWMVGSFAMVSGADGVLFGGEVYTADPSNGTGGDTHWTDTTMGTGSWPTSGYTLSQMMGTVTYVDLAVSYDLSRVAHTPLISSTGPVDIPYSEAPGCYGATGGTDSVYGDWMAFGGAAHSIYDPYCP